MPRWNNDTSLGSQSLLDDHGNLILLRSDIHKHLAMGSSSRIRKMTMALPSACPITWYNCGKLGHISKDCSEPKRATGLKEIEEEEDDQGNDYA